MFGHKKTSREKVNMINLITTCLGPVAELLRDYGLRAPTQLRLSKVPLRLENNPAGKKCQVTNDMRTLPSAISSISRVLPDKTYILSKYPISTTLT